MVRNKNKILIVDDHFIVRQGLMQLINYEPDMEVCAAAENTSQALNFIEKQPVDLAVVDISLNGESGLELSKKMKLRWPNLPIVIFSSYDELIYVKHAFRVGAGGYVVKCFGAIRELLTAIRQVLAGEIYISEKIIENVPKNSIYKILTEIDRDPDWEAKNSATIRKRFGDIP